MSTAFARRGYAGGAAVTSLLVDVTNATTSISAVLASTFPAANFHIVMDEGVPGFEEKIFVATRTGNNFTGCVRGEDGTSGVAHIAGATIRHILTAQDMDEANQVTSVLTTKGDLPIKKAGGATTGWDRLPVGANGAPLVGRSSASLGVAYELLPAEFVAALGAWVDVAAASITFTQGATVTKTATYAAYQKIGTRVRWQGLLAVTGAGTAATAIKVSLPFAVRAAGANTNRAIGHGTVLDLSASLIYRCTVVIFDANTLVFFVDSSSVANYAGAETMTAALASGDTVSWDVEYESV